MSTKDDLADLQRRVGALEERVEFEAGLRASMDEELADTKSFQRAVMNQFNALGQTLSDHGRILNGVSQVLLRHEQRFDDMDRRFDRIEARLEGHDEALARNDAAIARHDRMLADILAAVRPDAPPPEGQPG